MKQQRQENLQLNIEHNHLNKNILQEIFLMQEFATMMLKINVNNSNLDKK